MFNVHHIMQWDRQMHLTMAHLKWSMMNSKLYISMFSSRSVSLPWSKILVTEDQSDNSWLKYVAKTIMLSMFNVMRPYPNVAFLAPFDWTVGVIPLWVQKYNWIEPSSRHRSAQIRLQSSRCRNRSLRCGTAQGCGLGLETYLGSRLGNFLKVSVSEPKVSVSSRSWQF